MPTPPARCRPFASSLPHLTQRVVLGGFLTAALLTSALAQTYPAPGVFKVWGNNAVNYTVPAGTDYLYIHAAGGEGGSAPG